MGEGMQGEWWDLSPEASESQGQRWKKVKTPTRRRPRSKNNILPTKACISPERHMVPIHGPHARANAARVACT